MFVGLKTEHERQLNEITERFESIKHSLSVSTDGHLVILSPAIYVLYCRICVCFSYADILYFAHFHMAPYINQSLLRQKAAM